MSAHRITESIRFVTIIFYMLNVILFLKFELPGQCNKFAANRFLSSNYSFVVNHLIEELILNISSQHTS